MTRLHLKKVACGNASEAGKTVMHVLLSGDCQDLEPR